MENSLWPSTDETIEELVDRMIPYAVATARVLSEENEKLRRCIIEYDLSMEDIMKMVHYKKAGLKIHYSDNLCMTSDTTQSGWTFKKSEFHKFPFIINEHLKKYLTT